MRRAAGIGKANDALAGAQPKRLVGLIDQARDTVESRQVIQIAAGGKGQEGRLGRCIDAIPQ